MNSSTALLSNRLKAGAYWLRHQPVSLLLVGQAAAALLGLVYGKLTALYISPDELGAYNLWYAALMFLFTLLISPVVQSFKASLGTLALPQSLSTHGSVLLISYGALLVLLLGVMGIMGSQYLLLVVWVASVGQCLYALGNDFLVVRGNYKTFTAIQISYALGNVLLFVLINVLWAWQRMAGLWWALAILNALFAGLSFRHLWIAARPDRWTIDADLTMLTAARLRSIWHYALPLAGMAFWAWLLNYADRYLIRYYLTDAAVGYYAMAYSLGSKLLLLSTPFVTHLTGAAIRQRKEGASGETMRSLHRRYVLLYTSAASMACLALYIGQDWIGTLFLSARYQTAFQIAPLIALSYLFLTTCHLLEVDWYVNGQTKYILWHNVVGGVVNIGLNSLFIPVYGIQGAAIAMIGSTACQLGMVLYLTIKV